MDKSEIAILISLGSLLVSLSGLLFSVHNSRKARKAERLRAYDKVYHDASDLLVYNYKKKLEESYVSDDKALEKAVNEYANSHWLERIYGFNLEYPEGMESKEDKGAYRKKVADAYYKHQHEKHVESFGETMANRSPVFHLDDHEYSDRFNRLVDHVTNNLSYFSPPMVECWEKMRFLSPGKVRNEYVALRRVNESSCESIEEPIEDPYLGMLLLIRYEYRELNKPLRTKWAEFWFNVGCVRYQVRRVFNKKRKKRQWNV